MSEMFGKQNKIYPKNYINEEFEVIWKELTYKVVGKWFGPKRVILNNISGFFRSGQMMAIMGPSGCGKSSLLGCLAATINKGLSGSISISTDNKIKFSFISQEDYLDNKLSVREALMYSSLLKNDGAVDHKLIVENVVKSLNIENCVHNRPKQCSGGQRKRISIALELVSRPNVLILDEPTSGLDTVTTWQLMTTLVKLIQQPEPLAVVATIHQPSAKLFNLFNSVYLMSFDGQCIYHGLPQSLVSYLKQYGLNCPQFHNPSDFALEIAAKDYGIQKLMLLSAIMKIDSLDVKPHSYSVQLYRNYRTYSHIWTLTKRTFIQTIRDTFMLPIRVIGHILVTAMLVEFWGPNSGKYSGCADDYSAKEVDFIENFEHVSYELMENIGFLYFILLFIWFGSIFAVLLSFPQEMNIFLKEYKNGWYSCFSYYMSKVLVDLFFQLTIPNLSSIPAYLMTGQYGNGVGQEQEWRLHCFIIICMLVALAASSQGLLIGAWLMKWPGPAAFIGIVTSFPMILFSGFMIPIQDMPEYVRWITWTDFMRFAFESTVVCVYGIDRCAQYSVRNRTSWTQHIPSDVVTKLFSSNKINLNALLDLVNFFTGQSLDVKQSTVLSKYNYTDDTLYEALIMLTIIMLCFKILTYFVLLSKLK